jgi:hypothetical protein
LSKGLSTIFYKFNYSKMKKIFFSILAIALLSGSFAFAGKVKHAKKTGKKTECVCPKDCPKNCPCPPGCGH